MLRAITQRVFPAAFALLLFLFAISLGVFAHQAWAKAGGLVVSCVEEQNAESDYSFENGKIVLTEVSSGSVAYNENSKTLNLADVTMASIQIDTDVTIHATGTLAAEEGLLFNDGEANVDFVCDGATIAQCLSCRNFTMKNGSIVINEEEAVVDCSGNATIQGGRIANEMCSDKSVLRCDGRVTMNGGSVEGTADDLELTGEDDDDGSLNVIAVECEGFTMTAGTIAGDVCDYGDTLMRGGNVIGYLGVELVSLPDEDKVPEGDVTMVGGTVIGIETQGEVTLTGGTVKNFVNCSTIVMTDGTIGGAGICAYDSATIKGGVVEGGIGLGGICVIENGLINGDIDGNNHSGEFNGVSEEYIDKYTTVILKKGTINGRIQCDKLTMDGGAINCENAEGWAAFEVFDTFTMNDGSINAINSDLVIGTFEFNGGSITQKGFGGINCCDFIMNDGSYTRIATKEQATYIPRPSGISAYNFVMNGGTIKTENVCALSIGGEKPTGKYMATITGGTILVSGSYTAMEGISLEGADFLMTGGKVSVDAPNWHAIECEAVKYKGKSYGGNVTVTGGSLSARALKNEENVVYYAIKATSMSNKVGCLKKIKGLLPVGASFKLKSNEYKLIYGGCIITKYGAKSKNPNFGYVLYGGESYRVEGVGPKAFATKQGMKVKSIWFSSPVTNIDAKSFVGAKSLESLTFHNIERLKSKAFSGAKSLKQISIDILNVNEKRNKNDKLLALKTGKKDNFDKKAFTKCSKKITVRLRLTYADDLPLYRKFLLNHGLSSKAKVIHVYKL